MEDLEKIKCVVKESRSINHVLTKLGRANTSWSYHWFRNITETNQIDTSHLTSKRISFTKLTNDEIFCKDSTVSRHVVKTKLIKDKLIPYKCEMCGIGDMWNEKELTLILDHVDGIRNNNLRDNLRFLCPNCNSTLETHCVGNRKGNSVGLKKKINVDLSKRIYLRKVVNRPTLETLLEETESVGFSATGKKYGVSDNCVRKWIKVYKNRIMTT